MTFKETRSS